MKIIVFILLTTFFFIYNLYGQEMTLNKKTIKKSFKKEAKSHSNWNWIACNQDSIYFKNDTIVLYNNSNYVYYSNGCCNFINWNFINKKVTYWTNSQICREPPTSSVMKLDEIMELKFLDKGNDIYIAFYRSNKLFDIY